MLDLAVVIVSWNTRDLTIDAIATVDADLATSRLQYEIWIVDNGSNDGSAAAIESEFGGKSHIRLLAFKENAGFAGGNNIALRALGFGDIPRPNPDGPRAVYLLNSDTRTHPGATMRLYQTLAETPGAGLVGARLEYGDGSFQHSGFGFPGLAQIAIDLFPVDRLPPKVFGRIYNGRLNGRYPATSYHGDRPFQIDHPLGATWMLKREAIEQTGLFDEQFFMYAEEIDWAMRIKRAGFTIWCEPRALITHLSGQSTKQIRATSLVNLWRSRFRLFDKHYSSINRRLGRMLVYFGSRVQARRAHEQLPPGERESIVAAWETIRKL